MGTPYENPPIISDPMVDGVTVMAIDYPSRSIISAIKVIQVAGTPAVFTVEILNKNPDTLGGFPEKNFYICTPKESTGAGELLYFSDEETGGHGLTFFNQDTPDPRRIQSNVRKIYLRISAAIGGGSISDNDVSTFCVTLTSEVQVGGE